MTCYSPSIRPHVFTVSANSIPRESHRFASRPPTDTSFSQQIARPRHLTCCCTQADKEQIEAAEAKKPLPAAPRQLVFQSCSLTSVFLLASAGALRFAAPFSSSALFHQNAGEMQALLQVVRLPPLNDMLVALAAAGAVTSARQALLSVWPAFSDATDTSNKQVLTCLTKTDVIWLSGLPAISEEALFRGGLIPATLPDWRGAVIAAIVFGVLHNSGGRNWAFATWASAVGMVYGLCFLETKDLWVPVTAHAVANYASATLWLQKREPPVKS